MPGPPVTGPIEPLRDALAWGGVGSLVFLVLHQAYLLAGGRFLGFGVVVGGVAHWLVRRTGGNGQR